MATGTLHAGRPPATASSSSSTASSGSGRGTPRLRPASRRGPKRLRRPARSPASVVPGAEAAGYDFPQLVPLPAWAMPMNNTPDGELVEPTFSEALIGCVVPRGEAGGWGVWQELSGGLVRVQIRQGHRLVVGDIAHGAHTIMVVPDAPPGIGWEWVGNVLTAAVDATGKMVEGVVRLFPKAHQRMFGKDKPPVRQPAPVVAPATTVPSTPAPPAAATPLVQDATALATVLAQLVQAGRLQPAAPVPAPVVVVEPTPAVSGWVFGPVLGSVGCAGVGCRPKGQVGCGGSCGCGGTCAHGGA